uniref:Uncharacterized protein n=1 Tax=Meloidogyne enterolobii TaxID=390850 RepID=A0A6V7XMT4_MELEN|nr:unnamed protein product [Meloidogyne enterolobii]
MFNLIQKIVLSKPAKMINSFAMAHDLKMLVRPNILASRPFQISVLRFTSSSSSVPSGANFRGRSFPTHLQKGPSSLVSWTTVLSAWTSFVVISLTFGSCHNRSDFLLQYI